MPSGLCFVMQLQAGGADICFLCPKIPTNNKDKRAKIRFLEMKKRQEAFSNQRLEFFSSHNALQCSEELLFQIYGFNPTNNNHR